MMHQNRALQRGTEVAEIALNYEAPTNSRAFEQWEEHSLAYSQSSHPGYPVGGQFIGRLLE